MKRQSRNANNFPLPLPADHASKASEHPDDCRDLLWMLLFAVNHRLCRPPAQHLRAPLLHQHQLCPHAVLSLGVGHDVIHRAQLA